MSRQQPIDASRDSFDSPGDVAYSAAIFVAISAVYSKLSKFEFRAVLSSCACSTSECGRMVWCKGQWYLLLECSCEGIRRGITTDYITPPAQRAQGARARALYSDRIRMRKKARGRCVGTVQYCWSQARKLIGQRPRSWWSGVEC